jgi:hypothetical protein
VERHDVVLVTQRFILFLVVFLLMVKFIFKCFLHHMVLVIWNMLNPLFEMQLFRFDIADTSHLLFDLSFSEFFIDLFYDLGLHELSFFFASQAPPVHLSVFA